MSDRPLGRSLIRLGAMALGRSRAHRQDVWPHLAVDRVAGEVRWHGRSLARLVRLAEIVPPGAPLLAVVGSGPSLAAQTPERLPPGSAILCNGAASLAGRVAPLAVAVEDERFVYRHAAMLAGLDRGLPLLLSAAAMRAMAEHDASLLTGRPLALIDNLAKPVNAPRRRLDDPALDPILRRAGTAALSRDPDAGVVITGTVAFSAMQVALAAGPETILLAGIDLGNAASPRFYESPANMAESGLLKGLPRIIAGFALARDEARERGIRLSCASPVSTLLGLGIPYDSRLA
ncbi:glycosyl transferase [Paracoccus sp. S-4012]|uniref:glycosyl transferase n=1 Tax=Paracoccus sp. S-4012 TaxID=2665648 RepID=UPI0012B12B75|nr:glycosyl transferase [Paracoccus sp. S-4012]MRX49879.1 glycosyl transferase [Paracoccus sp. S-4012]